MTNGDYGVENLSGPAPGSAMKSEVLVEARAYDAHSGGSYNKARSGHVVQ